MSNKSPKKPPAAERAQVRALTTVPEIKLSDASQRAMLDMLLTIRARNKGKDKLIDEHARNKMLRRLIRHDRRRCGAAQAAQAVVKSEKSNAAASSGSTAGVTSIRVQIAAMAKPGAKKLTVVTSLEQVLEFAKAKLKVKKPLSVAASDDADHALTSLNAVVAGSTLLVSEKELPVKETKVAASPVLSSDSEGETNTALEVAKASYAEDARRVKRTPEEIDDLSALLTPTLNSGPLEHVRAELPAAQAKAEFTRMLDKTQVVIVVGETGCGKTTQIPQFVLEHAIVNGHGGACNIMCTQPRRIAAVSVAERIAEERGERCGQFIGYAIRLDARTSERTLMLFCTVGVLLRRLHSDPYLDGVTCVVVDEVHERGLQTDFLLILLREMLPKCPQLKVILMSATLNADMFLKYFNAFSPAVLSIPGRTFPVETFYLQDILRTVRKDDSSACKTPGFVPDEELEAYLREFAGEKQVSLSPKVQGDIDYDTLGLLVAHLVDQYHAKKGGSACGSILVFLPGKREIDECVSRFRRLNAEVLGLHSAMRIDQQRAVFRQFSRPKIICATNIAETSITINDVTDVIDAGHVREQRYNTHAQMSALVCVWVSQAAAKQRAGRAGRVQAGRCWRLYEGEFFSTLPTRTLCEMRRLPLEEMVLQIRLLDLPIQFLKKAPEPPSARAVDSAAQSLIRIGAVVGSDAQLTPLGYLLAQLPVHPRVGKMLVYGVLLRCLDPVLTVAGFLSDKSPFLSHDGRQVAARAEAFGQLKSDHLAMVAAYREWEEAKQENAQAERRACNKFGLAMGQMNNVQQLRDNFERALQTGGFCRGDVNANMNNSKIVRCALVAGLYPSVAQVVKNKHGKYSVTTEDDIRGYPALSSLLNQNLSSGWVVYHGSHLNASNDIAMIHDGTIVPSFSLLLFASDWEHTPTSITVGRWGFLAQHSVVVLFSALRKEMDRLLVQSILDTERPIDVVDTMRLLLDIEMA